MPYLINAAQLDKLRKNPKNVTILDVTWSSSAKDDFAKSHVAGARFLDLDLFCDKSACHTKMVTRDEALIARVLGDLGITNEHKIVFYDNSPMRTSCRALWMFKVFGHHPSLLHIMDGGFDVWAKFGGNVETGESKPIPHRDYTVNYQAHFIRTLMQMKANLHHPEEQVIDVRHPVRYAGGKEDRPGLRSGHIPNSFCFPFATLFDADGKFKSLEKIRKQLLGIGVDLQHPIVTTCGSGTTAPILNFILDLLGADNNAVYNGSWTEWGSDNLYHGEESLAERPVATSLDS